MIVDVNNPMYAFQFRPTSFLSEGRRKTTELCVNAIVYFHNAAVPHREIKVATPFVSAWLSRQDPESQCMLAEELWRSLVLPYVAALQEQLS